MTGHRAGPSTPAAHGPAPRRPGASSHTSPGRLRTFARVTDTRGDGALLRALVGGKAAPPDIRTLRDVHTGLVLLPDEAPVAGSKPADAAVVAPKVRRSAS